MSKNHNADISNPNYGTSGTNITNGYNNENRSEQLDKIKTFKEIKQTIKRLIADGKITSANDVSIYRIDKSEQRHGNYLFCFTDSKYFIDKTKVLYSLTKKEANNSFLTELRKFIDRNL